MVREAAKLARIVAEAAEIWASRPMLGGRDGRTARSALYARGFCTQPVRRLLRSHPRVRPGLQALPGLRTADSPSQPALDRSVEAAHIPDRLLPQEAGPGLHRRRPHEARGYLPAGGPCGSRRTADRDDTFRN